QRRASPLLAPCGRPAWPSRRMPFMSMPSPRVQNEPARPPAPLASRRLRRLVGGLAAAALIAACGSGDDEEPLPEPPVVGPSEPGAERGALLASVPYLTRTRAQIDELSASGL